MEKSLQVLEIIGGDKKAEKRRSITPYGGGGGLPPAATPTTTPRGEGHYSDTKQANVQDSLSDPWLSERGRSRKRTKGGKCGRARPAERRRPARRFRGRVAETGFPRDGVGGAKTGNRSKRQKGFSGPVAVDSKARPEDRAGRAADGEPNGATGARRRQEPLKNRRLGGESPIAARVVAGNGRGAPWVIFRGFRGCAVSSRKVAVARRRAARAGTENARRLARILLVHMVYFSVVG